MLLSLQIRNFALIDHLEVDLGTGINVLTGETGAGKSIILDAIDVVLGGRVNNRLIRTGTKKAIVEATFQVDRALEEWLQEQEIDPLDEGSIICCREIAVGKGSLRSRSRVNGVLVNRAFMEQLRPRLVEITAQGQTVQLMVPAIQRQLLDYYGGEPLLKQRQKVGKTYKVYQEAQQALVKRRQSEQERLQRLDWLEYQTQELAEANLSDPDELSKLEIERDRLSHVVELQNLSYQTYQLLYQNDSDGVAVADLLGKGEAILTEMAEYDRSLEPLLETIKGAFMEVVAAGQQINAYGDSLETDPEQLAILEERVSLLKQICRKYGPNLPEVIAYYRKLQAELE
ncbi:MAG: AAA family ATPase, partial [Spirulinaceae cyanobacterium]